MCALKLRRNGKSMEEYRYPKSGYTRIAVKLMYGERSKHLEQFSVFNLPPHNVTRLVYVEEEDARNSSMGPGVNMCTRFVSFGNGTGLYTTYTQGTGINTIVGLRCNNNGAPIDITSVMFSDKEYEYFENYWDNQVQYKVNVLSQLVRAIDTGYKGLYPLFVADFPNIAEYLLSHPDEIPEREALWP